MYKSVADEQSTDSYVMISHHFDSRLMLCLVYNFVFFLIIIYFYFFIITTQINSSRKIIGADSKINEFWVVFILFNMLILYIAVFICLFVLKN